MFNLRNPLSKKTLKNKKSNQKKVSGKAAGSTPTKRTTSPAPTSVRYEVLALLNQSFFETNAEGTIIWANKFARKTFNMKVGQKASSLFKGIDSDEKSQFSFSSPSKNYLIEKHHISKGDKTSTLYAVTTSPKLKLGIRVRSAETESIKAIIEEQVGKNAHLFSLIGMTVIIDLKSEDKLSCFPEFVAQTVENILFSLYLLFKDQPIKQRHLHVTYSQKSGRNRIYFQIPDSEFKEQDLGLEAQFRNKVQASVAEVVEKNELLLAQMQGRIIMNMSQSDNGTSYTNVFLSFDSTDQNIKYSQNN